MQGNYYAAGTGLLFCFTYLFVAINNIFKLSSIPFAWFSTFVAINAVVFGTLEGFVELEAAKQIDYYFMKGKTMDAVVANYRMLTGNSPMMPLYLFGYIQSKERYVSSELSLNIMAHPASNSNP